MPEVGASSHPDRSSDLAPGGRGVSLGATAGQFWRGPGAQPAERPRPSIMATSGAWIWLPDTVAMLGRSSTSHERRAGEPGRGRTQATAPGATGAARSEGRADAVPASDGTDPQRQASRLGAAPVVAPTAVDPARPYGHPCTATRTTGRRSSGWATDCRQAGTSGMAAGRSGRATGHGMVVWMTGEKR